MKQARTHQRHLDLTLRGALAVVASVAVAGCQQNRHAPATLAQLPALGVRESYDVEVARGPHGGVSTTERRAAQVGLAVLQKGGNAVDAAVAIAFAAAVTHPSAGNIGGGGFMMVRMQDGRTTAIDYRETAPVKARADMFLDADGTVSERSVLGAKAAGIPGTVAGLAMAHEEFGSLPWRALVAPAIALAKGHAIDAFHARKLEYGREKAQRAGFTETVRVLSAADGRALHAGETWSQPDLAVTLEAIAARGAAGFYQGPVAKKLVDGVQALGGIWQASDLRNYRAKTRPPIRFRYRGHDILTMPPPSSGGIALRQILGAAELLNQRQHSWRSAQSLHLLVESARRAYADRNALLGDPDFVAIPLERLIDPNYIAARVSTIDPRRATPSDKVGPGLDPPANASASSRPESFQTTHFSVIDAQGNAVANTYTLNLGFGCKAIAPGTGVLLNNEMDDFTAKPGVPNSFGLVQGEANAIEPGKRMLSSMTPTLVVKDGDILAATGAPGGSTIITTVAQVVGAMLEYDAAPADAIAAGRVHHQWLPDVITAEGRVPEQTLQHLRSFGHRIERSRFNPISQSTNANSVMVDPKTKERVAVGDLERGGAKALAY